MRQREKWQDFKRVERLDLRTRLDERGTLFNRISARIPDCVS
jgi:hypothetical protein